jgi:4-carboxymuconolactone decarboxylase
MKAGLDPAVAAAIAEGRRPDAMRDDEKVVYRFCTELLDTAQLSDSTYAATVGLSASRA